MRINQPCAGGSESRMPPKGKAWASRKKKKE